MTSNNCFENELHNRLKDKIILLGVGNEDRGDDALGPKVADRFINQKTIRSINCGEVPEGYTDVVINHQPDTIVFIDAIDFGSEPGDVSLFDFNDLPNIALDTHKIPLRLIMGYLKKATCANIFLIGVQPKSLQYGTDLSSEVAQSAEIINKLLEKISENNNSWVNS